MADLPFGITLHVHRGSAPERQKAPTDDVPWGVHPVIDMMKIVGCIAEQQCRLAEHQRALRRSHFILWGAWAGLVLGELIRTVL